MCRSTSATLTRSACSPGAFNIIPVIGVSITILLVVLVAAIDSWGRVLGVTIFYLIYLNLENSYLVPRIMKSRVDLPGLAICLAADRFQSRRHSGRPGSGSHRGAGGRAAG